MHSMHSIYNLCYLFLQRAEEEQLKVRYYLNSIGLCIQSYAQLSPVELEARISSIEKVVQKEQRHAFGNVSFPL